LFQAAFANFTPHSPASVDYRNDQRVPLLIIAGAQDHVSPVSINRSELKYQQKSQAVTAYKEFPHPSTSCLAKKSGKRLPNSP
jgi:hypothetical protein